MKKLHDLLVLKITQLDKETKRFPLVKIVGKAGVDWEPEFPVNKGWIDIYVPVAPNVEQPYVIEVETGYDFNCSEILQKHERFRRALTPINPSPPKLCVVIPPDFAEFLPLFKAKRISVFLWEGTLEWKCKRCEGITLGSTPWKPTKCSSCKKNERSLLLVGLRDFRIKEDDV